MLAFAGLLIYFKVLGWVVFCGFGRFLWRVRNVGLDVMHSKDINMGNPYSLGDAIN